MNRTSFQLLHKPKKALCSLLTKAPHSSAPASPHLLLLLLLLLLLCTSLQRVMRRGCTPPSARLAGACRDSATHLRTHLRDRNHASRQMSAGLNRPNLELPLYRRVAKQELCEHALLHTGQG